MVNLDEDLLHRASFKLDMKQKLACIEQNAEDILERAYAEGKILLYPYLGNGWMQVFKDRELRDKLLKAIE